MKKIMVVFLIIVILVLLSISIHQKYYSREAMATQVTYQTHIVKQGQTLWEISKMYYPDKDPRECVYDIKQLNSIDSIIYPGQQIMLPDYK